MKFEFLKGHFHRFANIVWKLVVQTEVIQTKNTLKSQSKFCLNHKKLETLYSI